MLLSTPRVILAALCFFFHLKSLSAAPVFEVVKVIQVRQEDGDDDGGAITDLIRSGQCQYQGYWSFTRRERLTCVHLAYDYRKMFQSSQNPTWYTISTFSSTLGTYLPYTTGNPVPALPSLASSQAQGTGFNVDHVLELQVVASFVQSSNPNPTAIPEASWTSLRDVVTNKAKLPKVTPIAIALAGLNNLAGIPSSPNSSKQYYFRTVLTGGGMVQNVAQYIKDANRRYLIDRRGGIMSVITNTGTALGAAGGGTATTPVVEAISSAWGTYAQQKYDAVITLLGQ